MAFGGGGGKGRVRSDINITPLVDVVLVLLIIFMVMTPILLKQIEAQVPEKADVTTAAPAIDQLVLKIASDGQLALNGEPVPAPELGTRVAAALASRREKVLFFDIADGANYGEAIHDMDVCRGSGARTLGLMAQ